MVETAEGNKQKKKTAIMYTKHLIRKRINTPSCGNERKNDLKYVKCRKNTLDQ